MTGPTRGRRWYRASFGASLVLAATVWAPVPIPGTAVTLTQASAILMIAIFATETVLLRRRVATDVVTGSRPFGVILLVGIAWIAIAGVIATFGAVDRTAALTFAVRYLIGLALVVAVGTALARGDRPRVALATVVAAGSAVVATAWLGTRYPSIAAITLGLSNRSEGLFEHPNQFGMVLSASLPIAIGLSLAARRRLHVLAGILVVGALSTGTLLSGSIVNALVAVVAMIAVLTLAQGLARPTLARAAGFLGWTVLVLVAVVAAPRVIEPISPRIANGVRLVLQAPQDVGEGIPSVASRLAIYRRAGQAVSEHPFVGIGGDNAYLVLTTKWASNVSHAHNLFLNAALGLGIVGLAGTFVFVAGWVGIAVRAVIASRGDVVGNGPILIGLGTGLLAFLLTNQSSDSLGGTIIYFLWVLLGVAMAMVSGSTRARQVPQ